MVMPRLRLRELSLLLSKVHQDVQVNDGGQAMVAGQVRAGGWRKAGRGRSEKNGR
jgi:hypothetical protein